MIMWHIDLSAMQLLLECVLQTPYSDPPDAEISLNYSISCLIIILTIKSHQLHFDAAINPVDCGKNWNSQMPPLEI